MKAETKRRISFYKRYLPKMRDRVVLAAAMLGIALTLAVTSTFAWVTISQAPGVANIATTLAANGSLEIALSKSDGTTEPDEFDVDEAVGINTDVTVANLKWGNLINISDASYGIDDLILRPASLKTESLSTHPLSAAQYGADGRITDLNADLTFAVWDSTEEKFFSSNTKYGVRAIATYTAVITDAAQQDKKERSNVVSNAHNKVNQDYYNVAPQFAGLGTMISKYAQAKLDNAEMDLAPYLYSVLPVYNSFITAMESQKDAFVALANFQSYMYAQSNGETYNEQTWDDLVANKNSYDAAATSGKSPSISLTGLKQFIADYDATVADYQHLSKYNDDYKANGTAYYWSSGGDSGYQIANMISRLIDYGNMTIDLNNDGNERKVSSLGSSDASAMLGASGEERKVYATGGTMYRFEQTAVDSDYRLNGRASCTITVKYIFTITIYGKAYTKASGPCTFATDFATVNAAELAADGSVAEDTYGMALDFWVRTNTEETILTLEGAVVTDEEGNVQSYDGVNRIWGSTAEAANLSSESTSQGSGSCYIYYADTPEDQARSLALMESMKVAFVSSSGTLLATAGMDTAHPWSENGRNVVPLVIDDVSGNGVTYEYRDDENAAQTGHGIVSLGYDAPTRITAIVYLDGTSLDNVDVLAASDIQGQLNLQFGSSEDLKTMGNNEVMAETRGVTASVSKTTLDYDTAKTDADMTTDVTVKVTGTQPLTMTAFFVRAVNAQQGQRQQTVTFTQQEDKTWTAAYQFAAPGTYYLRYIRMDGVDYVLAQPPKVEISGFAISSVNWGEIGNSATVYTLNNSYEEPVSVEFKADSGQKQPTSVRARFMRDDGNVVSVDLKQDNLSGKWEGTANIGASGTYTLKYLYIDENYTDISALGFAKTLDLKLGITAAIYNAGSTTYDKFDENAAAGVYSKNVRVVLTDNGGNILENLSGVKLQYTAGGSVATLAADLTWDATEQVYTGTLPITKAGRYTFFAVKIGSNILNKASESPTYVVAYPDPPIYDTESATTEALQFAPFTNDAYIGGIKIANSGTATVKMILTNSETGNTEYVAEMSNTEIQTGNVQKSATLAYDSTTGAWKCWLPTYTLDSEDAIEAGEATWTQAGTWHIKSIILWDCNDGNGNICGEEETYDENGELLTAAPLEWVHNYNNYNFSALDTEVSCTIEVEMTAGTTALGDADTTFLTKRTASETGMSVEITDGNGHAIPESKISEVKLTCTYATDEKYGYTAVSDYASSFDANVALSEYNDGVWTIPSGQGGADWTIVGEYKPATLTVTMSSGYPLTYTPADDIGIPEKYTVTSAGVSSQNWDVSVTQGDQVVFGKDGSTVNGEFLASYNPDIKLFAYPYYIDENGAKNTSGKINKVNFGTITPTLTLSHVAGTESTYGGYTYTGSSNLEVISYTMSSSGTNKYASSSKQLLAGEYALQVTLTVGDTTVFNSGDSNDTKLNSIKVYSVKPSVTITGVSPTGDVTVNKKTGDESYKRDTADTFTAHNYYGSSYAVVYAEYGPAYSGGLWRQTPKDESYWTEKADMSSWDKGGTWQYAEDYYATYVLPEVTLSATDVGSTDITFTVPNASKSDQSNQATVANNATATLKVGYIDDTGYEKNGAYSTEASTCSSSNSVDVYYPTQKVYPAGTQKITTVTSKVGEVTYTRTLASAITLRETTDESLKVTTKPATGMTMQLLSADIQPMSEITITATAEDGYYNPRLSLPSGVTEWVSKTEGVESSTYTFLMPFDSVTVNGTVTQYPTLTYGTGGSHATVTSVQVGDKNIPSGTLGVKPGTVITVTAAADDGYCDPALVVTYGSSYLDGAVTATTDYHKNRTFTFTMPESSATVTATAKQMWQVEWDAKSAISMNVTDTSEGGLGTAIANGGYAVPGHNLQIVLETSSGTDPVLTSPTATANNLDTNSSTYTYTAPSTVSGTGKITLVGSATLFCQVNYASDYAYASAITIDGIAQTVSTEQTAQGAKSGKTVQITLHYKNGYYKPRATAPSGVSGWTVVSEDGNDEATYSFKMPSTDVNLGAKITATAEPTVTMSSATTIASATCSSSYNSEARAAASIVGKTVAVHPGASVSLSAKSATGYFEPKLATASGSTAVTNWSETVGNDTSTYTFTMPDGNVTLSGSATQDMQLNFSLSNATLTVTNGTTAVTTGTRVHPGTVLNVVATANTNYYNPVVTCSSGGLGSATGSNPVTSGTTYYGTNTYQFTMPTTTAAVTLTAKATAYPTIKVTGTNCTVTVTPSGGSGFTSGTKSIAPGTAYSVAIAAASGYQSAWYQINATGTKYSATKSFTLATSNVSINSGATKKSSSCVTTGTLITLADGTQKPVEELTGTEELLVYDHETGTYKTAVINFMECDGVQDYTVISLHFSNGTTSKIIDEHGFFDLDLMRYVYFHEDDYAQYIGHRFYMADYDGTNYVAGEVTLDSVTVATEHIGCYSPTTVYYLNLFTDGLLSMPGGITGMFNFFACEGENLKYSEEEMAADIAQYGLSTYDDFAQYMSYETYCTYPIQYVSISLAKGNMTLDQMYYLIERYALVYGD